MNMESIQKPLFEDPIGQRFKLAREKAGLSQEAVARQLRLPVVVVNALENEDWARLGAPVYVRSYIGSYTRFLGLPDLADNVVGDAPLPPLRPIGNGTRARILFDRGMLNLGYLVMTAVIVGSVVMLAMHFNRPTPMAQLLPLDPPTATPEVLAPPPTGVLTDAAQPLLASASSLGSDASIAADSSGQVPVMASFAPQLPAASAPADGQLLLRFRKESWVNISDAAGRPVERGLIALGSERRYSLSQVSSVVLGNADAVEVSLAGRVIDLKPYQEANIARFGVSSAGQIAPIGD